MASLARNAVWNIVAGMSAAIVSVALPPFLARLIDGQSFSAWALALQIASYINLLNFGLQVIVGRLVARAHATGDLEMRDRVVATAFVTLTVAGLIGFAALFGLTTRLDLIVPDAPVALRPQIGHTILILALAFAVQLPASVFGAVFIGLQRNAMFANGMMATRILTFSAVLAVAYSTASIVLMGIAWFTASLLGGVLIVALWLRYSPSPRMRLSRVTFATLIELARDSVSFTVWNLSMLLVSGFQLLIVARIDYAEVGAFAVASSIGLFVSGIMQAVCSTLVPHASHHMALKQDQKVIATLRDMTMVAMLLSSGMSAVLIAGSAFIMHLWLGQLFTSASVTILIFLTLAQFIRNAMLPYVMTSIALGLQRKMIWNPLAEGMTSFVSALVLGYYFGATGVAAGMCFGSIMGVLLIASRNVLSSSLSDFAIKPYLLKDILLPSFGLIMLPVALIHLNSSNYSSLLSSAVALILFLVVTIFLIKHRLLSFLHKLDTDRIKYRIRGRRL